MDPWDPYSFSTMGSAGDPFNYYADPNYSTNFAPTAYSPTGDAMVGQREAYAPQTSPSQVPGTSGSPYYTRSATPGGVNQGDGTGTPNSPYGSLAGLLGLGGSNTTNPGTGMTDRNMKMAQLGMRMLAPPASPLRQGAPPAQLSTRLRSARFQAPMLGPAFARRSKRPASYSDKNLRRHRSAARARATPIISRI
jgi:hypothetical protein